MKCLVFLFLIAETNFDSFFKSFFFISSIHKVFGLFFLWLFFFKCSLLFNELSFQSSVLMTVLNSEHLSKIIFSLKKKKTLVAGQLLNFANRFLKYATI